MPQSGEKKDKKKTALILSESVSIYLSICKHRVGLMKKHLTMSESFITVTVTNLKKDYVVMSSQFQ